MPLITESTHSVDLAAYLFTRLHQLGIHSLHGLPGDFNLKALDYLADAGITWVGNCNELNAGYAVDGYARIKGLGALLTTFGVGELSAINALAGSYAEHVPVVHIVGTPPRAAQRNRSILHHSLGDGDFDVFAGMFEKVTVAQADLGDVNSAAEEIDRVLGECWRRKRPVYLRLPADVVGVKVDGERLGTPIGTEVVRNEVQREQELVERIVGELKGARRPMVLVDGGAQRWRVLDAVDELIRSTGLPAAVMPMGKGTVNETLDNFVGVYNGSGSDPAVRDFVESADLALAIGVLKSDLNTGGFSWGNPNVKFIDLQGEYSTVNGTRFDDMQLQGVLEALISRLTNTHLEGTDLRPDHHEIVPAPFPSHFHRSFPSKAITHDYLWPRISSWLRHNDILLTETGTAYLGALSTVLPPNTTVISQVLWGSIGYTLPAAQGAALAARELGSDRRVVLFEGDGSFQLTAQEISTMLRQNLSVVIFLIENDGYTIERWIHGMEAEYNDVQKWRYADFPSVMGAEEKGRKVRTREELEVLLRDPEFGRVGGGLQFVEMSMPREDAPLCLKILTEAGRKANAG